MAELEIPAFDEAVVVNFEESKPFGDADYDLIVHRNAAGEIFVLHSPMDENRIIGCTICESGAPVLVRGSGGESDSEC